uniref:Mic1 domain-containing protein n=1 Tax=Ditylenchus dipsaci TaxID=166011 RepID=A0A915E6W5_9BILA
MLQLGDQFVTFEPCSSGSDIFFDNVNQRICTVRGNGEMGVTAKGLLDKNDIISFRVGNQGKIRSLNFSTDSQIASILRDNNSADFVFLEQKVAPQTVLLETKQWMSDRNVVFITDQGLELYLLNSKKRSAKFLKEVELSIHWSLCYVAAFSIASFVYRIVERLGIIYKLSQFEADFGCSPARPKLEDRDVTIASIYERLSKINIYEFCSTDPFKQAVLTRTLRLDLSGLVGVQVIDNLVFVHHKSTLKTMVFDTSLCSDKNKVPGVLPACSTTIKVSNKLAKSFDSTELSLYLNSWIIFPPNLAIEPRLGIFSSLNVIVSPGNASIISDYNVLLDFLLKRKGAEQIFLDHILENQLPLINKLALRPQLSNHCQLAGVPLEPMQIDHNTIMRNVFDPLKEKEKDIDGESLLTGPFSGCVVDARQFNKLQQLLQYRVINDSKFLALELISLNKTYPALHQMGIDMLSRRDNKEQIAEEFISQGKFVEAVRCTKDLTLDKTFWHKLLEAMWKTEDRHVKYTVYSHLSCVRKVPFLDGTHEDFNKFTEDFKSLFDREEIEEAQRRFRLARIPSIRPPGSRNNSANQIEYAIPQEPEEEDRHDEEETSSNFTNGTLMLTNLRNFTLPVNYWITWMEQLGCLLHKSLYVNIMSFGWGIFSK